MNLDIAGVEAFQQAGRFFKENGVDFVEISFVGTKDTMIKKVAPEHMAKFQESWNAYCDGREPAQRKGTPLTDAPMNEVQAKGYIDRNVHTLEEIAFLSDGQCQALGHGTLTHREAARKLLAARRERQTEERINQISKATASLNKETASSDNKEVLAAIGELGQGINALVQLMTAQAQKKKPGRKPKNPEG